jgi:3-hydroxy acid dehydrogenase/malonic semialdehyde reductase
MSNPLIVLVTGASQGIGAATARHFMEAGHRVILAARNQDKLQALAEELGPSATPIACDERTAP